MHLFLLILFLWKTTEQAYVDERHMEAFLEGSLDGITKGLKGTVNQTIETKFSIVDTNLKQKFAALDNKFSDLEENNKEKIAAIEKKNEEKITALEKSSKEKISALEKQVTSLEEAVNQTIDTKLAIVETNLKDQFMALEENNKEKISALETKVAALEQERIKDLAFRKDMQAVVFCLDNSCSCPDGSRSCYKVVTDKKTWTESKTYCKKMGSHLVTIDSLEEHNILVKLMNDMGLSGIFWIGGNDIDNEGTWKWVGSNTVMGYTKWYSGQPNGGSGENCAVLESNFWWDRPCTRPKPFICERDMN